MDANCTILDRPLWPMDLARYNNEAIPIAVGNHELISILKNLLEGK